MQNLEQFNKKLQRDFPRYRVRESGDVIKIEVKVGSGYWDVNPALFKGNQDLYTQVKDGYLEWGEITPGDRARCVHCINVLPVPIREFKEVKCNWCDMSQPTRAYFELNDDLINHLRMLQNKRTTAQNHRIHNENLFDVGMDNALDSATYHAKWDEWKFNNGVRTSVPQNFRKVV